MNLNAEGGCLCGAVRYRVVGEIVDAGFCHCRICQRSSGAPLLLWFTVPANALQFTEGEATIYRSSTRGERGFCAQCGTQVTFRLAGPETEAVDITVCSLDDPSAISPDYHIWTSSRLSCVHFDDGLPDFPDAGPDG